MNGFTCHWSLYRSKWNCVFFLCTLDEGYTTDESIVCLTELSKKIQSFKHSINAILLGEVRTYSTMAWHEFLGTETPNRALKHFTNSISSLTLNALSSSRAPQLTPLPTTSPSLRPLPLLLLLLLLPPTHPFYNWLAERKAIFSPWLLKY